MKTLTIQLIFFIEALILLISFEHSFAQITHFEGRVVYTISTQQRENESNKQRNLKINNTTDIKEHIYQFKYPYILVSSRREEIGIQKNYLYDLEKKMMYIFNYKKDNQGITYLQGTESYKMNETQEVYAIQKLNQTEKINGYSCNMYKITHTNQEGHLLTQYAWYSDWQPFLIQFPSQEPASADDIPTFVKGIVGFPMKIDLPMYFSPLAHFAENPYDCLGLVMTLKEVEPEKYSNDLFKLPFSPKK